MRAISWAMAAVFVGFTIVQFNDVDALIWVAAYGACALLSVLRATGRVARIGATACALVYAIWAIVLLGQTSGHWWDGETEREVGGLAIATIWCLILAMKKSKA